LSEQRKQSDECFILIKAQPHRSSKYFETVCCAGVGRDGKWRRQYPVPFRILEGDQQFRRWDWIKYDYIAGKDDKRVESQKVLANTLEVTGSIKRSERASFLNPLIRSSFEEANEKGESLTLLRPQSIVLNHYEKSYEDLLDETRKHEELANQLSLFDPTAKPLKPCPMQFVLNWVDADGKKRQHENDDWETSAAYNRFERMYGHDEAIRVLKKKYEEDYFEAGVALGFSTHSRRNITYGMDNQWLLVGLVRLDVERQDDLFIG